MSLEFLNLLTKTKLLKFAEIIFNNVLDVFINPPKFNYTITYFSTASNKLSNLIARFMDSFWNTVLVISIGCSIWFAIQFIHNNITLHEILHVTYLGFITATKVIVLIIASSMLWIPVGVWIGLNPKASRFIQPLIQFFAAFPVNFFYPIAVVLITKYSLNKDIWTAPLIILGTQWYILFNIIAGAARIPKELKLAAKNFRVSGWLWWKRLMLPSIFPYYITGAITAAGGCWNASIVAEYVQWGDNTIVAVGIGSYITQYTQTGDFPRIALGIVIMSLYVVLFNRLIWRRLYNLAEEHFTMD